MPVSVGTDVVGLAGDGLGSGDVDADVLSLVGVHVVADLRAGDAVVRTSRALVHVPATFFAA